MYKGEVQGNKTALSWRNDKKDKKELNESLKRDKRKIVRITLR